MNRTKSQGIGIRAALWVALVGCMLQPGASRAQHEDAEAAALFQDIETNFTQEPAAFDLRVSLSYSEVSGNSNTSSGAVSLHLDRFWANRWGFVVQADGTYSSTRDSDEDAESYSLDMAVARKLSERFSLVLLEEWYRNRLAGLNNRVLVSLAGLWHLVDKPQWQFTVHAGLGTTHEEFATGGPDDDYASGLFEMQHGFVISPAASAGLVMTYHQDLGVSENYRFDGKLSLNVALNTRTKLRVEYDWKFDNQPVSSLTSRTDTVFSTGVTIQLTRKKQGDQGG